RVADLLLKVTSKPGEDLTDLDHLYGATWAQWTRELNHVAVLVGGFDSENKHGGEAGPIFTPVSKARQQAAVAYLNGALFHTPQWLLKPDILRRLGPDSGLNRLLGAQRAVLRTLLDRSRLGRLQEIEATDGDRAYALGQLFSDLREGIFTELKAPAPRVDAYRRNLQRAYLELLNERLNLPVAAMPSFPGMPAPPAPNAQDDQRGAIRAELKALQGLAAAKAATARDRATRAHLDDLRDQIAKALDPRFQAANPASAAPFGRMRAEGTCWPTDETED
ncbi:MAG TPA: zinc-dependent metalloprotease, partial [Holophagaceae bacterium]